MGTTPRVRFAPSPTGYLHIGGARTALFNWLFARGHGGTFVLRIEDTDVERSSWDMVAGILDGMRWLGLDWDEGPDVGGPHAPYFQSQRLDRYRAMADQLVATGHAYACYCTPESLQAKRDAAEQRGEAWRYDRTCPALTADEIAAREAAGVPRAIRFKVPPGEAGFEDLVHGPIQFDGAHIEDFVVLRSDRQPTYHLSVVADDIDMAITHVVRGDDHISNTPKQVLLYRAFDRPVPKFAHVPLILGPDKKRLSKRHGATSVMEYQRMGYLPDAMVNFLALLGWGSGSADQEIFSRDELTRAFTLEGISGGNAVFNPDKLDWFNAQYIARLSDDELTRELKPFFEGAGLWREDLAGGRRAWFHRVLVLLRPRAKRLAEFPEAARPFFEDPGAYDADAVKKHVSDPAIPDHLAALAAAFAQADPWDEATTEATLRATADARGVKAGPLIHATRLAMTGRAVSPGLFELLTLCGREATVRRLERLRREVVDRSIG